MKKWIGLLLSICIFATLTGCSFTKSNQESNSKETQSGINAENTSTITETNENKIDASSDNKSVVVFFSGTGNTKVIAKSIAEELSSSIYEIKAKDKYTDNDLNYSDDNCRANKEQQDEKSRPEIANDLSAVTKFDKIYLGYPIWWGTNPRIIETFLDTYDLSGKTVYTFCTSGSSGIETSIANLQKLYSDVNIVGGNRFEVNAGKDVIAKYLHKYD